VLLVLEGARGGGEQVATQVAARYGDAVRTLVVPPNAAARGNGVLSDPHQALRNRYHAGHGCLYVVRPDGYVGFTSRPAEAEPLIAYLDEILIPQRSA
jgi:hypothetical protein